jgi:hypothetical protein
MSLPRTGDLYKANEIINGLGEGFKELQSTFDVLQRGFKFLALGILCSGNLFVQGLNLLNSVPPYLVISIL